MPNEILSNTALILFILLCGGSIAFLAYLFAFVKEVKERIISALIIAESNAGDWSFVGTSIFSVLKLVNFRKKKGILSIIKDLL